ncbi:helix-turn-helix domain-containing protein [Paucibacter sp. APW11]|uniref:Helix-turn-helix domain-containing protein n=1 Tax=Roseateles aquae TaxID=3077235 RepID=A0ABU3PI74_9BURK|nr:helix-turn-helix domain-containing protein [Paucibacter sp. APW11]MDT9002271.1 helix-turn-helix domain-containing protein [Paucibacter sp. APW11]
MHPQALPLLDAGLRGAVVATLLLFAGALWRERRTGLGAAGRLAGALALGLVVQAISSLPLIEAELSPAWQAPWVAISVGNGVLFWLFAQALFDDEFRLRRWHGGLWLAVLGGVWLNCALAFPLGLVSLAFQRAVPVLTALAAAWPLLRHWRGDLLEWRRHLRGFIVVAGSAYALLMAALRLTAPGGRLSQAAALLDMGCQIAIGIVVARQLFSIGLRGWIGLQAPPAVGCQAGTGPAAPPVTAARQDLAPPVDAAPAPEPAEVQAQVQALQQAMREQRLYREEAMSLAALALRLKLPEYRLRRLINQQLGYRNFNAYLNDWRLADARQMLADPARRELPVLTIALEAGFQSIGPFNRAFKADTGLTPTEFRQRALEN